MNAGTTDSSNPDLPPQCQVVDAPGWGLKSLASAVLGYEMVRPSSLNPIDLTQVSPQDKDKSVQVSDWASSVLSPAQLQYAALDASIGLALWLALAPSATQPELAVDGGLSRWCEGGVLQEVAAMCVWHVCEREMCGRRI